MSHPPLLQPTNLAFILLNVGFEHTINPDSEGLLARILRFNSRSNLTKLESHNLNLVLGDAAKGRCNPISFFEIFVDSSKVR